MSRVTEKNAEPALQKLFAPVLAMLSFIYGAVVTARAWLYVVAVLPSESSGAFVVSIGNVQAGGTGKTPVTAFFANRWSATLRIGIVSRGYGRSTKGSLRVVAAAPNAAGLYGDEPTWLAQSLQRVPVQVGENRVAAAHDLIASEGVKLILLDDGFQHLRIRRSFDFVLVDASAPAWHWRLLPWGRLREPIWALGRADALLLTKTDGVSDAKLVELEQQLRRWAGPKRPVIRFQQRLQWDSRPEEAVITVAGLANPAAFSEMVSRDASGAKVRHAISFRDHHVYTPADVEMICAQAAKHEVRRVLVTEKDAVKLVPLWLNVNGFELVIARLEVQPARESDERQLERLDEIILGQVRSKAGVGGKLPRLDFTP